MGPLLLALSRQSGIATAPPKDVEGQSPNNVDQVEITASPTLRLIFIVVAAAMLVVLGLSLIPPIESWGHPNEDGFSYVPAFWATIICLPVGLYLLAGAIAGRGRHVARARNALFIGGGTLLIVVAFLIFQHFANSMGGLGLG
jgi:hypothetical protein